MASNQPKCKSQRNQQQSDHAIQKTPTTVTKLRHRAPECPSEYHSRIPEPQAIRVKLKYISGQPVRQIARDESLARATVTRVVKSEDVRDYVAGLRAQFYSLGDAAISAVRQALQAGDGRLGYQILTSIGAIPSVEEKRLAAMQPAAAEQDRDAGVKKVMAGLAAIALQRARVFGTPLGQLEEDLEEAGGKFDQETGTVKVIE